MNFSSPNLITKGFVFKFFTLCFESLKMMVVDGGYTFNVSRSLNLEPLWFFDTRWIFIFFQVQWQYFIFAYSHKSIARR
jgi:hypothetical protein